jgi:hypothetical protein
VKKLPLVRVLAVAFGCAALVALLLMGTTGKLPFVRVPGVSSAADSPSGRLTAPGPPLPPSADDQVGPNGDRTDFEGDDVSPAVATYGIDRDGNLFEVHSPHTEVPRLPSPTL